MEPITASDDLLTEVAGYSHLIIFDGVCNFCEASVNFIIDHDAGGTFRFVPSQTPLGEALQQKYAINTTTLDTVVLIREGDVFTESEAAFEIARELDGAWRYLSAVRLVPRPLRDWAYRLIARNRYRWFGRKQICMVPTAELRARFLG
jgi:predicted DCC family thiol-disulfide oxidoreductase YuxK